VNKLQIEYALALAHHKNFTAAAESLYVTQPAFSKQIAGLERELGLTLFLRTSKAVELTPAGETMIGAFKNMGKMYENALLQARRQSQSQTESLSIGFLKELGDHPLLIETVRKMVQIYPNADIRLESSVAAETGFLLETGLRDVMITIDHDAAIKQGIKQTPLFIHRVGVLVPASHPLAELDEFDSDAFKRSNLAVVVTRELANYETYFDDVCKRFDVPRAELHEVPNLDSMLSAVEAGRAAAIFSITARVAANPAIKTFDIPGNRVTVAAIWREENRNSLIRTFIDLLNVEVKRQNLLTGAG
jgi:DNA-binding transcriptional LysR family regulator